MHNDNQRKVTLCKRKKGILKKMIELSVLCDLKIFALIQDESNQRVTHFASHKDFNIIDTFNKQCMREFFSNSDYDKVGGVGDDLDSDHKILEAHSEQNWLDDDGGCQDPGAHIPCSSSEAAAANSTKVLKVSGLKRRQMMKTSRIGTLKEQKKSVPVKTVQ